MPIADVLPQGVVDHLETPRWILLSVCLIGVLLAYMTDEGYSLLVGDDTVPNKVIKRASNRDPKGSTANHHDGKKKFIKDKIGTNFYGHALLQSVCTCINDLLPVVVISLFEWVVVILRRHYTKFELYRSTMALKKKARTKRHFFYLMEKKILSLPIEENETEIDSYLDCKNYLGETWPFMWEVANVKDEKVTCNGFECYPMSSYSYLDLIRDQRVQKAAIKAAETWSSGNHGPRMLGGNMTILRDLEKVIAAFFGRDDSLLCATGYLACMSACAAVSTENAIIFADTRLHASLRAGLKIGEAKVVWFKHNDFDDCERLIKQYRSKYTDSWMIVESVYSMDGDICNLPEANRLCQMFDIKMMIDEAHGLGVVGKTGRGVEELYGLKGCATLIVGTFSKSVASIGGYITGSGRFINYLDFHCLGNVFSAPLPAYSAGAALKSFELMNSEPCIITKAQTNSQKLRKLLETGGGYWPTDYPHYKKYDLEGDVASTVLPIVFPDDIDRVMRIATKMKKKGYMCSAVAYPACPLRRPRFRITATSAYCDTLIDGFVKSLVETCVEEEPSQFKQDLM